MTQTFERMASVCWAFVSVLSEVANFLVLGSVSQLSQVWVARKVLGPAWCKRRVRAPQYTVLAVKSCLFSESLAPPSPWLRLLEELFRSMTFCEFNFKFNFFLVSPKFNFLNTVTVF